MTEREALKLALEALECKDGWGSSVRVLKEKAVTSLRTSLSASKIEGNLMQRFYDGEEAKSLISEAEETITALREALAEQTAQQEPVAWFRNEDIFGNQEMEPIFYATKAWDNCQPLYTTPPQRTWVGLTEEELQKILQEVSGQGWKPMLEAIEAKLKEKNGIKENT